ncbi:TadE family type IV pilus minor pilin [Gordonia soli]|uniref:Pilus assembly protein TadE n=1 Tax=Gordonia soli NBRC 108243 TaxID=1223545 RepID=M0QGN2_9ACTN|nr:TadE family type IV pilus minor pilin [Gordonia soli]GAC67604.1 hypothetical protein GS4_08_01890 [Gordonia soli NBRC 108243]
MSRRVARCVPLARLARDDRGMVTVEAAFAIAAIVSVIVLAVGVLGAVTSQIRCTDAAREVARLSASGDAGAESAGRRMVGDHASISVQRSDDRVTVEVSVDVPLVPMMEVSARAVAAVEPDGEGQVRFAPGVRPSG